MQNMKFKVRDVEHSAEIQKALFAAGYGWRKSDKTLQQCLAQHLFADFEGYITYDPDDHEYFIGHANPEYVLFNGQLMKASEYFKYPKTPPLKEPEQKPPVGLRPKVVADNLRLQEVLEAMHRYVQASKPIPFEWREELADLLDKQEGQ